MLCVEIGGHDSRSISVSTSPSPDAMDTIHIYNLLPHAQSVHTELNYIELDELRVIC